MHARINLDKTNYDINAIRSIGIVAQLIRIINFEEVNGIYTQYCRYKQFPSVMPLFEEEYLYPQSDVMAYYDDSVMVGFTLLFCYNTQNLAANQFAWTYHKPEIRLGINSLHHICAYYKSEGYKYLYLGDAAEYKQSLDGFEICGPI